VDGEHPSLVHLAPAVVGTPDPGRYCERDGSVHISRTDLTACPDCGGPVTQDPDVLDTWFSSGLWPFSTLGWPDETPELRRYYPTSVLVTAYDILFFWVARMAMLGLHVMKEPPFHDVFIHTLVRDAEGQKMSKVKGNVIDPLEFMGKYGTDAFRFTLAALTLPVRDIRVSEDRVEAYRNFANKLWNAARLVLSNLDGLAAAPPPGPAERDLAVAWIEGRLQATIGEVRTALDAYRFNDAASAIYQFVWNDFCDWYLEIAKLSLYRPETPEARTRTQRCLAGVLETTLRLLHPFMPFITEELWQRLPHEGPSIMIAPFPRADASRVDGEAMRAMDTLMGVITAVRTIRGEMRLAPGLALDAVVRPPDTEAAALFDRHRRLLETLARATITIDVAAARPPQSALAVTAGTEVYVRLAGVVDLASERQRLVKEIGRVDETIRFLRSKLEREDFVARAPAEVVERERSRLDEQDALRAKLAACLSAVDDAGR
jgi:valyl-tRNA synthetase